jgi:galactokinase/mevalonate kinase-like predicted kinase
MYFAGGKLLAEIIATAPGRCGIVGNPTDMYGGQVLSCTVQERAESRLTAPTEALHVTNADEAATLRTRDDLRLRGDKLDIVRAALLFLEIEPETTRFSLHLGTDIPMQAGLAGSTALLATLVGALDAHFGWELGPHRLAETIRTIEARIMQVVCGFQDQYMTVFGGLNFMNFAGKESLEQTEDEPLAIIEPLAALVPDPPLLLAHTGIQHHSGTVHRTPRERWLAGEPLVRQHYAHIAQLAQRGKRALLAHDWPKLGALMNENHTLVAELGGSGPANERLIAAARGAGAWGAKLAGAGGGGTILALTDDPERVGAALLAAGAECLLTPQPQPGLTITRE